MSNMEEVETAEARMNAAQDALLDYVEGRKTIDRDHYRRLVVRLKNAQAKLLRVISDLGE